VVQESDYTSDPICRLCGVLYSQHLQCPSCGIYCGPGHFQEVTTPYRDLLLCFECIKLWQGLEGKVGREIPWIVFKNKDLYYGLKGQPLKEWPVSEKARR